MKQHAHIVLAVILLSCDSDPGTFAILPTGQFEVAIAFVNLVLNHPVDLQNAGDGSGRLFVVEQAGRILVFPNLPSVAASSVFLDIQDRVSAAGGEEGLLGLAFHPDFPANGYFYVNYVAPTPRRTVVSRFSILASDPDSADPASELVLLEFEQPFSNHNGGQVSFGPDGYLYIATGDGGSGGDPMNNGQTLTTLLGKILRIDITTPSGGTNYSIPPDNPFVGTAFREEIFAYGLRNPWRFSFDTPTGRLWAGDVGQGTREEIDIIRKGGNYGWRVMEGVLCFNAANGCDTTGLNLPVLDYGHDLGESVTGGFVYRGTTIAEFAGAYIYGDYVSGRIWALRYDGTRVTSNELIAETQINVASFGVDEDRELFICGYGGTLYKFIPKLTEE